MIIIPPFLGIVMFMVKDIYQTVSGKTIFFTGSNWGGTDSGQRIFGIRPAGKAVGLTSLSRRVLFRLLASGMIFVL
jgi:hypothetical protein